MALMRSIAFSILASTLATVAARRILSVTQPLDTGENRGSGGEQAVVVVIPVIAGNSNNRIGWVKEVHHHHHRRRRFGRHRR